MTGTDRPHIVVLAGVNGAGKSSVGGAILQEYGQSWFNPDRFSRELIRRSGCSKAQADAGAWAYGKAALEAAIANATSFNFETTLGGNTIPALLKSAAASHDVVMIFCGLASPEQHLARVRQRVSQGGHDIPEEKIRQRWTSSRENLIRLLPSLAWLQVFDNSADVAVGQEIPAPVLVLEWRDGKLLYPAAGDVDAFAATPDWAKPIVAGAVRLARNAP